MDDQIVNRVAASSLVTIDLDDYYVDGERIILDLKNNLENGFLLREKAFRQFISETDWQQYAGKYVGVHCSTDAIIPNWVYMLVASKLSGIAAKVIFGDLTELESQLLLESVSKIDPRKFQGKKVVVKGCGKMETPPSVFIKITGLLKPFVSSLMFGEPCSTVPVYKKPKP